MLPIEILRHILSYISIDLILLPDGQVVLRRNETHPICRAITEMIKMKWKIKCNDLFDPFYYYDHDSWDEEDILRHYRRKKVDTYIYKHCGLVRGCVYINVLCVKNGEIICSSVQKYLGGYYYMYMAREPKERFQCEVVHMIKKNKKNDYQPRSVYYLYPTTTSIFIYPDLHITVPSQYRQYTP